MIKAPSVSSLRVALLSANHAKVVWDDVGANFYYFVSYAHTRDPVDNSVIPADRLDWSVPVYTKDEFWYTNDISPNTHYKFRVSVTYQGFSPSDWVETEEVLSFKENAYYISAMPQFTPVDKFVREKFVLNNEYVNFNTNNVQASLMKDTFVFSSLYEDISNIKDDIIKDLTYHEVQGPIEPVCVDDKRVMFSEIDTVLYLFERFQSFVKVSNNKGQTWKYYQAFNDRVGNPVSRTVICQNSTSSFVLGYEVLFFGADSTDVRWSSDSVRFSNNIITFTEPDETGHVGFKTEQFGIYASLPPVINRRGEAITCSEEYVYVAARNTIRRIKTISPLIDTDPDSPTYRERIFEPEVLKPTANDKIVIKKMETLNGQLYVYVSGEVETLGADPTTTPVRRCDEIGIYRMNGDNTFTRVYGEDLYERKLLQHEYSNLSCDGDSIFVSTAAYWFKDTQPNTVDNPAVTASVRYITPTTYSTSNALHQVNYRTTDGDKWTRLPSTYYNEADYTWMARKKTRSWITHDNRTLVVYPETVYTKYTDTLSIGSKIRINGETEEVGRTILNLNNVSFDGFNGYANGIMFHGDDGKLIGFYQFAYRTREHASIVWRPSYTMMIADLVQQKHDEIFVPEYQQPLQDPDLSPLVIKMCPENYLDGNFNEFSKYYLQFISKGTDSSYNKLLNLIRNQYPLETDNFTYLWSEIKKRNIYLDEEKRNAVVRFFEARATDFYSTKGIEASYQFLFKLLYNEEVQIDLESKASMEYDIIVESENITDDIVGTTIYTPSGRCNVTYIDKAYNNGRLQWTITIHNMMGKFHKGQVIRSEKYAFTGDIIRGIQGKDIPNIGEYPDRGKTYYVMRIKSALPMSRYKDDVVRFIHPAGFGFVGITLITILVNFGLSMKHYETIVNIMKKYRWDSGFPSEYPEYVADIDVNTGMIKRNAYGEPLYLKGPKAGTPFPVPDWYDTDEKPFHGVLPSARRFTTSPLFDASTPCFSYFRNLNKIQYKDNNDLPRDPVATQVKV